MFAVRDDVDFRRIHGNAFSLFHAPPAFGSSSMLSPPRFL